MEPDGRDYGRHPAADGWGDAVVIAIFARMGSWLRSVARRGRVETDMEEEIRFHLEARAADLMRQGVNPRQAMRQAKMEFGEVATHLDEMRRSLGLRWW